jgi:hypothetical protein
MVQIYGVDWSEAASAEMNLLKSGELEQLKLNRRRHLLRNDTQHKHMIRKRVLKLGERRKGHRRGSAGESEKILQT